jgi:XRE family transcriptional regulator of biofilm formation
MTLGIRIKTLRLKKKMSMNELAKKSGLNVSYISLLESGKRTNPTVETLVTLARILGTTAWYLIKR